MTEVGSIVGTAQYLSPEQARGRGVGPQTDIYSLGVVLYEMLAGRVPFEGDSSVAIAMQHVSDQPPPLRALAPDVPESLALVVAHAMLKDPAQRYGSADEFAADLDRVRRGLVPVAATAAHTAIVARDPTELVPAVEATRIAPRAEATPLLSGEQPLPARRRRASARAGPGCSSCCCCSRSGRSRRSRSAACRATTRRPRPASRRRPGKTTTVVASHTLDDLEGKTYQEAKADAEQLSARPRHPEGAARARCHARGQHRGRERSGRRVPCCTAATRCASRSRAGRWRSRTSSASRRRMRSRSSASNFRFSPASEASDSVDRGNVTRTDPAVGTTQPVGSTVTVYISTGPATVEVPKLVGRTEADARATLSGAGLIVREPPGSRCSDAVNQGQVAKQNPEPGTPVHKGRAIAFDLANSPVHGLRANGRGHADRRRDRAPAAGDDQPELDQADAPARDRSE